MSNPKKHLKPRIPKGLPDYEQEIKNFLENLKQTIEITNASFYLGKAISDPKQIQSNAKSSATKRSILGDNNSIYTFLKDIDLNIVRQTEHYLNPILHTMNSINSKIPELKESEDEDKKSEDIQKVLIVDENNLKNFIDEVKTKFSDEVINQLNSVLSNVTKQYEALNDNYYHTIETLSQINASNQDKLDEIKDAKIKIIVEGLKEKNIKGLTEFTKLNMDQLTSNIDSIDKFFNALQKLEGLKLKDSVDNIKDLQPVLTEIKNSVVWISDVSKNINQENIDNISKLFNTVGDGSLYNLFIFLNDKMKVLKLDDKTSNQLINSFTKLTSIIKSMSILFNKELLDSIDEMEKNSNRLNKIDSIFKNISQVFGNIDNKGQLNEIISSINNIEKLKGNKVKEIETSLIGISKILGELYLMYSLMWPIMLTNRLFGKINISKIFENAELSIKTVNNIEKLDNKKGDLLISNIKEIRKLLKNIHLLAIESFIIGKAIGKGDYGLRVMGIFDDLSTVFEHINENENLKYTLKNKFEKIDNNIKLLEKTLLYIVGLKSLGLALKINFLGTLSSIKNIFKKGNENSISKLFETINESKIKVDIKPLETNIESLYNILSLINKLKLKRNIQSNIDKLFLLFISQDQSKKFGFLKKESRSLNTSLPKLFEQISNLSKEIKDNDIKTAEDKIKSLFGVISVLNEIGKQKKIKNIQKNIDIYFKALEEFYKQVDEKFDNIIKTSEKAEQIKAANEKIKDGLDSCSKIAVDTGNENEKIQSGIVSLEGLTSFMISAAVVMSIGALFMMLGGGKFVAAALEFGVTLMVFELLVLSPVLIFRQQQEAALKSLNNFNGFIVTCTITMLLGALFIQFGGGKYVKNALAFGILLSIFEFLVVAPFLAFNNHKSNVMQGLNEFSTFLFTCTVIMSIGALIVNLQNGKFIKNAIKFGLVLGLFELLVITPFIMFGLIKSEVFENSKDFISIVITCTTIMLVGALFMSIKNGALVKGAIRFAATLMLFEMLVIAPFLLMNLLKSNVYSGMKLFSGIIISSTIILMVGALFMNAGGGKYWKDAIAFTGLLMVFEIGVILPFLLFNFIKRQVDKGMIGFAAIIFVSTTVLMMGALFMTLNGGKYAQGAQDFAILLGLFVGGMGLIAIGLSHWLGNKELAKMQEFSYFVLISSMSLIIGAMFIKKYGLKAAENYAIILGRFVAYMGVIALILSKWMGDKQIEKMQMFGVFVLLSSVSLIIGAWFISQYGSESVMQYAIILGLFSFAMAGVAYIVGKAINAKAILAMEMLGTFLLLASGSLIIGASYIEKYGTTSAWKFMGVLLAYIGGATVVFALLEFLTPLIILGIATATLLGVALLTLTTSLMLVNSLFILDPGGKKTTENIGVLNEILDKDIKWTFTKLGLLSPFIALGSVAAIAMGVSLLILDASFEVINIMMGKHGEEIKSSINVLKDILGDLKWVYTYLGLLSGFIALGSIAAIAIGVSMTILGGSLYLIHKSLKDITPAKLLEEIGLIGEALIGIGVLATASIALIIPLGLAMPAIIAMNLFCLGISSSILMINHSIKEISNQGDLTSQIDIAVKNMIAFVKMPSQIFNGIGIIETLKLVNDICKLNLIIKPMSEIMLESAKAIQSIAELKVPSKWDKDGHAIEYRQLNENDFNLAKNNTGTLLTTMADAFVQVWKGKDGNSGLKSLWQDNNSAIYRIIYFGKSVGEIIKGVAEGVGSMAKMQIPIAWDDKGNPIGYRQLRTKDFELAKEGVGTLLTSMVDSLLTIYGKGGEYYSTFNNGKNIFDELDEESPFMNVLNISFRLSELIGNVGKTVADIAKMQIPVSWDDKGHPTGYVTLNKNHFKEMGDGVSNILGAVVQAIADLYTKPWATKDNKNIFDIDGSFISNLFSDSTSPFERVLSSTFNVSKLIGNIGSSIKDLAVLQIPTEWDHKTGKAINYERLTPDIFQQAGDSVGKILTSVVNSIEKLEIADLDNIKAKIDSLTNIHELISGVAEGIVKLSTGQVAKKWDPKTGKPIEFETLTPETYNNMGIVLGDIINSVGNKILQIGKSENSPTEIVKSEEFKSTIESISSMTGFISGIVDSIIKIGSSQIPDQWDLKTGKPIHYTNIDINNAKTNMESILSDIITSISGTIIGVYTFGQANGMFNTEKESPFNIAVRGISEASKIVGNLIDPVIKLGSAMIPDENAVWKDGKPSKYKLLGDPTKIIENIKKILGDKDNKNGLLYVLCDIISEIFGKYFAGENNDMSNKISIVNKNISNILKIVSNVSQEIDKDGNIQKFFKINIKDIENGTINIKKTLEYILGIPVNDQQNKIDENWKENISSDLTSIGEVIKTLTNQIKIINEFGTEVKKTNIKTVSSQATSILTMINSIVMSLLPLSILTDTMIKYNELEQNIVNVTDVIGQLFLNANEIINNYKNSEINSNKILFESGNNNIYNIVSKILNNYKGITKEFNLLTNQQNSLSLNNKYISDILNPIYLQIKSLFTDFKTIISLNKNLSISNDKEILNKIEIIGNFYDNALLKILKIYSNIENIKNSSSLDIKGNSLIELSNYLGNIANVLSTMFNGIGISFKAFYDNVNNFENTILTITNQLGSSGNTITESINNLKENIDKLKELYNGEDSNLYVSSFSNNSLLNKISFDLGNFITTILTFDQQANENGIKLNNLTQSIYNNFTSQKAYGQAFDQNTKKLKNYIQTVNSVKIDNVNALTTFIKALNNFAYKFGNLDDLTDAIANKLVIVLNDLIAKLEESAKTINTAQEMQKERKKAIESSIEKIKLLMENPISIKVSSDSETTTDDGQPTSGESTNTTPKGGTSQQGGNNDGGPTKQPKTPPVEDESQKKARGNSIFQNKSESK